MQQQAMKKKRPVVQDMIPMARRSRQRPMNMMDNTVDQRNQFVLHLMSSITQIIPFERIGDISAYDNNFTNQTKHAYAIPVV